jgi:hypothetical protein
MNPKKFEKTRKDSNFNHFLPQSKTNPKQTKKHITKKEI